MEKFICPVCKTEYPEYPYQDICDCGIQFGYDDAAGISDELRQKIYDEWRRVWIKNGKQKLSSSQKKQVHETTHPQ